MKFGMFFMLLHLLQILKFSNTNGTYIHRGLRFHLPLPLTGKLLSFSPLSLLRVHLFGGILIFLHLLFMFLLELLHSYWRSCFFLFNLSLSLSVIVVVLLLRPFFCFSLSFSSLVWQGFEIFIIWFVSGIQNCNFLPGYSETRVIGFSICNWSLFRSKKLNKSKIFIPSCQFIFDLPYIFNRGNRFKKFQEQTFLYITEDGSSQHQTTILSWLLSKRSGWGLCAVA